MFKDYLNTYYVPIILIILILLVNLVLYLTSSYFKETRYNPIKVLFNKGLTGEYLTFRTLNKLKAYKRFIFNLNVPLDDKSTEIDIIMISNTGIYVFESKNYSGLVYGSINNDKWIEVLGNGQKYPFYNPLMQNNTHINYLKHYLHDNSNIYFSIIVFSNETELKTNIKNVLNRRDVIAYINDLDSHVYLDNTGVDNIYNLLRNR